MNSERPYPSPADAVDPAPSAARAERCTGGGEGREPDPTDDNLRALRRLRDLALTVAENLAGRIVADDVADEARDDPKPKSQLPAMVLGFQRAERGVRQSILLSTKLYEDRLERDRKAEDVAAWAARARRERRKKHVARLAKEAIERGSADEDEEFERLQKLDIRLDEEDIENDLGRLADSALVDRLCKDCGVEAPWELWDGEYWTQDEARTEPSESVYAGARRGAVREAGPDAVEPVEAEPSQPAPPQSEADAPAASADKPPEPERPPSQPGNPREAMMKARLVTAMRSGAWLMALQMDPMLAEYVRQLLNNSS